MTQTQTLSTPAASQTSAAQDTRRQQTVARLLGAQSFATLPWRQLLSNGVLVHLHIGRCRFTTRLLLEDVGIQIEDPVVREKLSRWTTLGEKRLLPANLMKSLNQIEGGARSLLRDHSFRTELGYFVPVTAYEMWLQQTERFQEQYFALRDEIVANHRELAHQVLADYEVIAADTYQRLRATHPNLVPETQQHFVVAYCNRIASQIPTPERIRDSFAFRFYRVEAIQQLGASSPEMMSESETLANAQVPEEVLRSRALLAEDVRRDAQARVQATLDDFLTRIVAQLRHLTYHAALDVLATLQRRGGQSFSGRSTMQLNNLINCIRRLNFFGDGEIEQMMARVQAIVDLSPAARQRSIGEITQTFRAIATITRATLLDLGEDTRAPRADLGIATVPTDQVVHAARAELRLPPLDRPQLAALAPEVRTARAELAGSELWPVAERQEPAARGARTL